jgi:uncharacterized protein YndB with AHSA1/START domain
MVSGDKARVSVLVEVPPEEAFEIFTRETDSWWRQGPKYRIGGSGRGQIGFECGPGGRLFETFELPSGPRTFVVGRVLEWDPPAGLAFEWRGVNFKPDESTRVDVTFRPSGEGTLVTVEHGGWSTLPEDHPARHGLSGRDFSRMIGMWWGELLTSMREHSVRNSRGQE